MEQNSVTNSSNAGANLRKEDIRQMIEQQDTNEEVQKHFGFLWQILTFSILDSKQLLFARAMQYSFDLKPNLSLYIIYYHIHDASPSSARCCAIK